MAPHRLRVLISSTFSLAVLAAATGQAPAVAEPLPYGPDTCIDGYVWRDGRPGDHVCVTPAVRDATAQQNADGAVNREPNGGEYGPNTCKQGFVWREAFGGDAVCVTPDVRDQARADNAAAESRKLANQAQPPVDPPIGPPLDPPKPPDGPPTCPQSQSLGSDGTCITKRMVITIPCLGHNLIGDEICPLWAPPPPSAWTFCPDVFNAAETLKGPGGCPKPW